MTIKGDLPTFARPYSEQVTMDGRATGWTVGNAFRILHRSHNFVI